MKHIMAGVQLVSGFDAHKMDNGLYRLAAVENPLAGR